MKRANGDGRKIIDPDLRFVMAGTCPMKLRRSQAKLATNRFDSAGQSNHSAAGAMLWVILEHCHDERIPFTLQVQQGLGYCVTKNERIVP